MRETATQRLMLQRGEAHVAVDLTSEDMDALKDAPGVVRIIEPEYRTFSIKMNTEHGPLADINLRKAISYAFNYQAMLDAAGYADLMTGPLPHRHLRLSTRTSRCRAPTSTRRRSILAKTQTPNGGIKLRMVHVSGLEQQRRWALIMLDSLKQLNIDLDIKPMIWPDMVALCQLAGDASPTSSRSTRPRTTAIRTTSPSPPTTRRATATGRTRSTRTRRSTR